MLRGDLVAGKQDLSVPSTRTEGAVVTGIGAAPDWGADEGTTALATPASVTPLVPLSTLGEQARAYAEEGHAANTRRAYRTDWRAFTAWCGERELVPLPAAS